jgi:hypothetical protein
MAMRPGATVRGSRLRPAPRLARALRACNRDRRKCSRTESWELTLQTPVGPQVMTAQIVREGAEFKGTMTGEMGVEQINGKVSGDALSWTLSLKKPVSIKLTFDAKVAGNSHDRQRQAGYVRQGSTVG